MKVFLSHSGAQSRKLAEALAWWLPKVLQKIEKVFISTTSIELGEKFPGTLMKTLEDYDFGIACLTSTNTTAPWVLFESGAIAKKGESRLIPLLCDMEETDLPKNHPLSYFNYRHLNEEGMRLLVATINKNLDTKGLKDEDLKESFDIWWPRFKPKMEEIIAAREAPKKDDELKPAELKVAIEEMLSLLRRLARLTEFRAGSLPSYVPFGLSTPEQFGLMAAMRPETRETLNAMREVLGRQTLARILAEMPQPALEAVLQQRDEQKQDEPKKEDEPRNEQ